MLLGSFLSGLGELVIPRSCAGCGAPGDVLCGPCREKLRATPRLISHRPRTVGMPVFALGPYDRMRRSLIVAMKEYNNQTVRAYVGAVLAAALRYLHARGEIPHDLVLVPAPTRVRSARQRSGDPVLHMCEHAARTLAETPGAGLRVQVLACLRIRSSAADQSRLDADARWENMAHAIELRPSSRAQLRGAHVVLVDDVVTTGATLAASASTVRGAGALVRAGLTLADA